MQVLSLKTKRAIDEWLLKFPPEEKKSGVIFALKTVQAENAGYLTLELMDAVAAYLDMPKIAVYEVASFYSMFELEPLGKYKISVCTNVSCMLNDSDSIVAHLEDRLKIQVNETTADGLYTLREVECLCACGGAPVMQIGDTYYENLTRERVDEILAELES